MMLENVEIDVACLQKKKSDFNGDESKSREEFWPTKAEMMKEGRKHRDIITKCMCFAMADLATSAQVLASFASRAAHRNAA